MRSLPSKAISTLVGLPLASRSTFCTAPTVVPLVIHHPRGGDLVRRAGQAVQRDGRKTLAGWCGRTVCVRRTAAAVARQTQVSAFRQLSEKTFRMDLHRSTPNWLDPFYADTGKRFGSSVRSGARCQRRRELQRPTGSSAHEVIDGRIFNAWNHFDCCACCSFLLGAWPAWPYSSGWGYYPSGTLGLVLVVVLVLALLGRI